MNSEIANFLDKIAMYLKFTPETTGSSIGFTKSASIIREYEEEITLKNYKNLINISGIGDHTISEIGEFLRKGTSKRLEKLEKTYKDRVKILDKFMKIYGVGPIHAYILYEAGARSYNDIKRMGLLKEWQIEYIKYIKQLETKIPRNEMLDINEHFKDSLSFNFEFAGSFRRGQKSSSDYDMIVRGSKDISMKKILEELDEYILFSFGTKGKVFHGVITYEYGGVVKYRRIDISIVPEKYYPCFLLHSTGPKELNIAMSTYAIKKNFTLNKYMLVKHYENEDKLILVKSEEDVFRTLGLEYIPPTERTSKSKLIPMNSSIKNTKSTTSKKSYQKNNKN